ncbi:MAG: YtxH domain-containing protein [Deltaproteobacteria bacterium]|nr:YtxH domain-containing protein [Deltaproteobacteria bacterium]
MSDKREESSGSDHRFKYFLYGGIVGTLAMLLFAPKSGKETREIMAEKAQEGKEAVEKGIRRAQESIKEKKESLQAEAEDLLDKAKNLTKHEKETIVAAIEAGKNAYREEKGAHE